MKLIASILISSCSLLAQNGLVSYPVPVLGPELVVNGTFEGTGTGSLAPWSDHNNGFTLSSAQHHERKWWIRE